MKAVAISVYVAPKISEFIDEIVSQGFFHSKSDYIEYLIRKEMEYFKEKAKSD